jgi:hypothetical protein
MPSELQTKKQFFDANLKCGQHSWMGQGCGASDFRVWRLVWMHPDDYYLTCKKCGARNDVTVEHYPIMEVNSERERRIEVAIRPSFTTD